MDNNKYKDTGLGRIGNAISQLGHAIAWGSSDVSISSKADYMASDNSSKLWKVYKWMVDFAFAPIDGKDHTGKAYDLDPDENYEIGIGLYQDIMCGFFIFVVCPFVSIITYSVKWIEKIINR